jgi:hypothetical protein
VAPAPIPPRRLRIRTVPTSATLFLDGRTVANPYDGRLPDGSSHALIARADGFHDTTQQIELSADRELLLRLEPNSPQRATSSHDHHSRSETRASRRRAAQRSRPHGAGFVTESPY